MVPRAANSLIRSRHVAYPAVALVGPRQSGKTTLARSFRGQYYDLELEPERLRLNLQWDAVFGGEDLVVLDEAQSWPELFPRLRATIDADRRPCRALLLGSVSPALMTQISESLAGRLAIVELTPLLAVELPDHPLNSLWLTGGYPDGGVLQAGRFPWWQLDYLTLLVQRDLPSWGLPARPQVIDRMTRMVAASQGQVWNASRIGQSLGLSHNTVNSYLDYLEGAFLVRRLPAYQANIRKRLTKSPKLYVRDAGLLHALLRVTSEDDLLAQPWVGASWEGFVIEQILGALAAEDRIVDAFHFRTSDQHELDLVVAGRETWAFEIKLTTNPGTAPFARLHKVADMVQATTRVLVSQTGTSVEGGDAVSCNLPWLLQRIVDGGGPC